jgi:hypothetical protein
VESARLADEALRLWYGDTFFWRIDQVFAWFEAE